MTMIEVDHDVSKKLAEKAMHLGITRNGVLRQLLRLDKPTIPYAEDIPQNGTKKAPSPISKNIQEELIPHIVMILYENGGKATKSFVEKEIFMLFQHEFEKPYYNETVSHGVLRWKHHTAWAKERAKQRYGFIKGADESGRGIWELTDEGVAYYENNLKNKKSVISRLAT